MKDLNGKVIILTGATGGIGAATAKKFAEYGAKLVLADLEMEKLEKLAQNLGLEAGKYCLKSVDISDDKSVKEMIQKALDCFGTVDVLVNNAGFSGSKTCLTEEYDINMAQKVLNINTLGTLRCMQAVLPIMRQNKKGVIVNTASIAADRATPFQSMYAASKAAVVAMTKSVAWEYGRFGIRAIAVGPSAVDTQMIIDCNFSQDDFSNQKLEEIKASCGSANAFGRIAQPEEIANLIVFLSSDMASFMTGFNVFIDGGNRK